MDVGGGEEVEGAGRGRGRGRGRGCGRVRYPAAVGDRQPAARNDDINRLTRTTHVVGAVDFQVPRMLELRCSSVVVSPPPSIVSYVEEVGFGVAHPLIGLLRADRMACDLSEMIITPSWGITCGLRFL
ncbi:hypothetical protein PIB30_041271 [Stylosanthes scabra]|uniref:Uncharacterized protein n=1 Tax=Stylosanthes scabra TaxID=79078 RepID=A0ABU6WIC6_9FABA|nr:hypothetical protein [Stylosanthes scabra]